ncbi:MAG: M23 family peptidase, partial [Neglectibacter sp.]
MTEGEDGLDEIRVKALFYALYFGADSPGQQDCRKFADCFVAYEERTRTVTVEHEDGTNTEEEETYTVAVPIK